MKILQIGAPKSGNLWLYNILKEILTIKGGTIPSYIQQQPIYQIAKNWELNYPEQASIDVIDITDLQTTYRISSIYKMPVDNFSAYISKTQQVWTHSPICKASRNIFKHFDKKIYIIRDPRDRAVSAAGYFCSEYMLKYYPQPEKDPKVYLQKHFEDLMHEWIWHVFDHLKYCKEHNLQIVFYESLLENFQLELENILNYLEIQLGAKKRYALQTKLSFSAMKKTHPKHLVKGRSGYWQEQLSDEQQEKAIRMTAPLLNLLGYNNPDQWNPSAPFDADFNKLKEELIASNKNL